MTNRGQILLYLHSRYESILDNTKWVPIALNTNNKSEYHVIHYQKTIVELLPKPYKTSCADYKRRIECLTKCKILYYKQISNQWPSFYYTDDLDSNWYISNTHNRNLEFQSKKRCEKVCGKSADCFKEYFLGTAKIASFLKDTGHNIYVFPPILPNTIFIQSAKMQIEEYLSFIASIISLWFGFSILMLSDVIVLIFSNINKIVYKIKAIYPSFYVNKLEIRMNINSMRMLHK
jgi:hypothetical protein